MTAEKKARPYQVEAMRGISRVWAEHRSALLVMATGLGKTFVFCEVASRRNIACTMRGQPARVLVLAHRTELITQAQRALESVGMSVDVEKADQYAHRTPDLMGGNSDAVVASVQTLRGSRLQAWPRNAFGTVIVDEAHHSVAAGYLAILEHFAEAKVLGVTATPDRTDELALRHAFDGVAFEYDIRAGIRDGWLAPLDVRSVSVGSLDLSGVVSRTDDLSARDLEQALNLDSVHHEIAAPLAELAGSRSTVVFTAGVDQASALAIVLSGYVGAERVGVVHGRQTPQERAQVLGGYSSGAIQFVLNCAVLTEGFDAPRTSCVAMCRPTKSRSLYTQCVGRGTRLWPEGGKEDCLVLDFRGNAGQHKLTHPGDALAGRDLSEREQKDVEEFLKEGRGLEAALTLAEQQAAQRAEAQLRAQQSRWVKTSVKYDAPKLQAYEVFGIEPQKGGRMTPATPAQLQALSNAGVKYGLGITKAEASRMLDALKGRREAGQCTYKQALVLLKHGLRTDIQFEEARTVMDGLAKNNWRPTEAMLAEWGAR